MGKMEIEVKVLNIDESELVNKILKNGGRLLEKCNQNLYTYDIGTTYGRFMDILYQINNPENRIKLETAYTKLKLLFFDMDNFMSEEDSKILEKITGYKNVLELLNVENLIEILNAKNFQEFMYKFGNNSKKWIRLRKTNDKSTIAIKHILKGNDTKIQQMLETEFEVPNFETANDLLEELGFAHKSYQEKRRDTYLFDNHEIDIDTWPGIPTYFEVEGKNEKDLEDVLNKLGYSMKDTVSCTADEIYEMNGKSMFDNRELKFTLEDN